MIFKNSKVVVENGQFRTCLWLKHIVVSWMVQVMGGWGKEKTQEVKSRRFAQILCTCSKHIVVDWLDDIGCVDWVMIVYCWIGLSIGSLYLQGELLEFFRFYPELFTEIKFLEDILEHKVERISFSSNMQVHSVKVIWIDKSFKLDYFSCHLARIIHASLPQYRCRYHRTAVLHRQQASCSSILSAISSQ